MLYTPVSWNDPELCLAMTCWITVVLSLLHVSCGIENSVMASKVVLPWFVLMPPMLLSSVMQKVSRCCHSWKPVKGLWRGVGVSSRCYATSGWREAGEPRRAVQGKNIDECWCRSLTSSLLLLSCHALITYCVHLQPLSEVEVLAKEVYSKVYTYTHTLDGHNILPTPNCVYHMYPKCMMWIV